MTIERIEPGPRMSQAVLYGGTVYLAGQVSKGDDVTAQTRDALAQVDQLLALAGTDKSHLLSVTIWLATMDDFDAMNAVYDAWVDQDNPPARACGEARLATAEYLVEFLVIAAKPDV
jgi:enamine deaminase RidA (YjgF/YER057c/UK114 family)